ncbi:MAG: hypothetical protein A2Y89_03090 [Chloroflexi bacterium RBG_13_51_18]|nr:MAG: hypothetical protein A2Y89_03090 [Chloroflexi bacterium RBG_13_51_18]
MQTSITGLPDLTNKRFVVLGIQGSGKSVLVKYILKSYKHSIVYDVLREHQGLDRYFVERRQVVKHNEDDPAIIELNNFVNQVVIGSGQIRLFVLEEANRYCPPKPTPLPSSILDLNDFNRHDKIAWGAVARRPSQLNTDLIDLAHYLFLFELPGKHDRDYLSDIIDGLGEAVRDLPPYHFIIVEHNRKFQTHKPIPFLLGG